VSDVLEVKESLRDWREGSDGIAGDAVASVSVVMRGEESVRYPEWD